MSTCVICLRPFELTSTPGLDFQALGHQNCVDREDVVKLLDSADKLEDYKRWLTEEENAATSLRVRLEEVEGEAEQARLEHRIELDGAYARIMELESKIVGLREE